MLNSHTLSFHHDNSLGNNLFLSPCRNSSFPSAVPIGDFNRQFLGQMSQLNQLLGEVKDLLRQQVTIGWTIRKAL